MSFFKKYKKKFVAKLRQLRKYYRYKVYFPKKYESYCNQPVQENKVLFLEMRFTTLSNSFQYFDYEFVYRNNKRTTWHNITHHNIVILILIFSMNGNTVICVLLILLLSFFLLFH